MLWRIVQSWIGGQCVAVLLTAIFPQFGRMKNTLPASQNLTVQSKLFRTDVLNDDTDLWIALRLHRLYHLLAIVLANNVVAH